mmetsp:Transcript_49020/g.156954  ORF Transcript_49020/g.156954 Transcript_49020/m.156954 type:complete len:91 (+) Transcript_49020:316-588(+)
MAPNSDLPDSNAAVDLPCPCDAIADYLNNMMENKRLDRKLEKEKEDRKVQREMEKEARQVKRDLDKEKRDRRSKIRSKILGTFTFLLSYI